MCCTDLPSPVPTKWGQGSDPGGMPWKQGRFCWHICGVLMRCRWAFVHFFLHLFAGKPVRSARLVCAYISTSRKPCEVYPCIFYTTCRKINNHHQGKRWPRGGVISLLIGCPCFGEIPGSGMVSLSAAPWAVCKGCILRMYRILRHAPNRSGSLRHPLVA